MLADEDILVEDLPGLGPASAKALHKIAIFTKKDLLATGAFNAYIRLICDQHIKPNLNYLYALVAAEENRHWLEVAKNDKHDLVMQLDGYFQEKKLKQD